MEISPRFKALGQMSPVQQLEWASTHLPPWVALALVLVLAWQLATLVWAVWPGQAAGPAGVSPGTQPLLNAPDAGSVDTALIKRSNLFGAYEAQGQPVVTSEVPLDAPETRLRLVLKGTVADRNQSRAFAIIGEDGGGDDKVYFVEDGLPGNATLHTVYPDRVLLSRAGKLETLTLKTLLDKESPGRARAARPGSASRQSTANLRDLRQKLAANPAQITEIIRPQPVFANGQQIGYRVYPGRDRKRFVELGLRPGDLVTEVNGTALNDPAQGQQLFQQITQSDVINLTVQRSGQTKTLTLRMDE